MEGKLRVWANVNGYAKYYPVETVEEAKVLITAMANSQLEDDSVDFNAFGLEVLEELDEDTLEWCEYFNDLGEDITLILYNESN